MHQFPKRNREILVGKLLPQGVVGIGQHLDAFMETMLSRLMLCLSILSSTASATWNLNTLSKEVYMVIIPEHVSFVCPYGYTNGGFLAIEQTVNPGF